MSRSYKHTPYSGLRKHKSDKKIANRKVRSYLKRQMIEDESFSPAAYKKVSESWNICDYYDITTWSEHLKFRKEIWNQDRLIWGAKENDEGELDEENEYQLWRKWYKRK